MIRKIITVTVIFILVLLCASHKECLKNHKNNYNNTRFRLEKLIIKESRIEHIDNLRLLPDIVFYTMVLEMYKHKIPTTIYFRTIDCESGFQFIKNKQGSSAFGYWQIMPSTFNYICDILEIKPIHNQINNIIIGSYLLKSGYIFWKSKGMSDRKAWEWSLAEYNQGRGGLQIIDSLGKIHYSIPPETMELVHKEMKYYKYK